MVEDVIFLRQFPRKETLVPFGFTEQSGKYVFEAEILDGSFHVTVTVEGNSVTGRVTDAETGDDYVPARMESGGGSFAARIREAYIAVLEQVREQCFTELPFLFPQTNRVAVNIFETYGESMDHPFEKFPSYTVFRCRSNQKWYALFMDIPKQKLTGEKDDEIVEVLNVKIDPEDKDELLQAPGIYPSYHMNKNSWISILLDDTLTDETVMDLINKSRAYALSSGVKQAGSRTHWIVPANPKYYDIDAAFRKKKGVTWKQSSKISAGDIIYMYVGSPVSAIRYKCVVTKPDIPFSFSNENVSMKYIMEMDVLKVYPQEYCPFAKLNELGVKAVRGPRSAPPELIAHLEQE